MIRVRSLEGENQSPAAGPGPAEAPPGSGRGQIGIMVLALAWSFLVSPSDSLASIGLIAFAAMAQFTPHLVLAATGGGRDPIAARASLGAGLGLWLYTLALPPILPAGWLRQFLSPAEGAAIAAPAPAAPHAPEPELEPDGPMMRLGKLVFTPRGNLPPEAMERALSEAATLAAWALPPAAAATLTAQLPTGPVLAPADLSPPSPLPVAPPPPPPPAARRDAPPPPARAGLPRRRGTTGRPTPPDRFG